jgi:hypothetical protein
MFPAIFPVFPSQFFIRFTDSDYPFGIFKLFLTIIRKCPIIPGEVTPRFLVKELILSYSIFNLGALEG